LLAITLAIANVIDIFTDIVAVSLGGVGAVYLGLLNALSYIIYILGLFIGSKLADRGKIKLQILMSLLWFSLYNVLLARYIGTYSTIILVSMYISYSIMQAFARTSINAYIHEFYPSIQWRKLLVQRAVITIISEALLLLVISTGVKQILSNIYVFALILLMPVFLTYLVIRDPSLKIERTLYKLEVGLRRIENIITDNLVVYTLLTSNNGSLFRRANLKTLFTKTKYIKPERILASLICFRFANAILLIQLPIYLSKYLGLPSGGMLMIYGLARLMLIMDLLIPFEIGMKAYLFMIARGLIPFLFVVQAFKTANIWISLILGLIIYFNNRIDVALYSMYIESLGKAESARYLVMGELTGFTATMISGIIYSLISYEGVIMMSALIFFMGALLIRI
ncbi:MAG: hypothetical protein QXS24_04080, partial [Desulfurococcaceae archaeon]